MFEVVDADGEAADGATGAGVATGAVVATWAGVSDAVNAAGVLGDCMCEEPAVWPVWLFCVG